MQNLNPWPLVILAVVLFGMLSVMAEGWDKKGKGQVGKSVAGRNSLVYIDNRQINIQVIINRPGQSGPQFIDVPSVQSDALPGSWHPLLAHPSNN